MEISKSAKSDMYPDDASCGTITWTIYLSENASIIEVWRGTGRIEMGLWILFVIYDKASYVM
ncbi:hypothetical protein FRC09_011061, partial [Ceratobasidium sp. 395]